MNTKSVAPRYFHTLRIPLTGGREFSETDQEQSLQAVIINENMSRRYWAGRSAVGGRLRDSLVKWHTVIGVVRDVKYFGPTEPERPWIYYPLAQYYSLQMTLVVRTAGDPWQVLAGVRGQVRALDGTLPVFDEKTLVTHCGITLFWIVSR